MIYGEQELAGMIATLRRLGLFGDGEPTATEFIHFTLTHDTIQQ